MLDHFPNLVLASKSPRRSYLLKEARIPFTVRVAEVEEIYPDDLPALQVAPYLARLKAHGNVHLLQPDELLLTADSVVLLDDRIYGKPGTRARALEMVAELSGRTHTVVTGCCLKSHTREEGFTGTSYVTLAELTAEEIEWYVDTYRPYDKAGSYGIQDWIGLTKVTRLEGTYANVMGLPVDMVYERVRAWG